MSGSFNKVKLVGYVGLKPKIIRTDSSKKIIYLSLATSKSWKDEHTGERRYRISRHRIVIISERLVCFVANFIRKGARLYLEGALCTRSFIDKDGILRFVNEVVLEDYNAKIQIFGSKRGYLYE